MPLGTCASPTIRCSDIAHYCHTSRHADGGARRLLQFENPKDAGGSWTEDAGAPFHPSALAVNSDTHVAIEKRIAPRAASIHPRTPTS